jgi:hypothetical protein
MKCFAVTLLVFLNTSHSTEIITEIRLKSIYAKKKYIEHQKELLVLAPDIL